MLGPGGKVKLKQLGTMGWKVTRRPRDDKPWAGMWVATKGGEEIASLELSGLLYQAKRLK